MPGSVIEESLSSRRLIGGVGGGGYPATIRVEQGSEVNSRDIDLRAYQRSVTFNFSRLGKPTKNTLVEAVNGRLRAECPNAHRVMGPEDMADTLEAWPLSVNACLHLPGIGRDNNEERSLSASGHKVRAAIVKSPGVSIPSV